VHEAAELLGLTQLLARRPSQLSGGQRQRVAMGRAIVREPKVFLMDEPLSNLDAKLRVQTRTEIAALQARLGITTVYVTHDQVEAMTLGDRIAVMREGVVQQLGTPEDIYSRPATRFVAEFIGSPAMNMVGSQRAANGLQAAGIDLALTPEQQGALKAANASEITYGLRPESLAFGDTGLPGTLAMIEPTGPETYALVDTPVGKLTARVPGKVVQAVGEKVFLRWAASDAHLFDTKSDKRVA
jgi:multiple sugar transport system ATP-binding protein